VKLAVAYRCQFESHHLECIRLAREKEFGDVKVIEAAFGFTIGDPTQWRLKKSLAGGGAIMDVGVYALQAARYISGEEPVSVSAFETKTDPVKFAEVDESIMWHLKFPSGVLANCTSTYNARGTNHFRAYCDGGSFWMSPAYSYSGLQAGSSRGPIEFPHRDHFLVEMDDFARCILEDRESIVPGEEGLRDLVIVEAVNESIRTGRTVSLV
jgi:predicted dehydrogenase